MKLSILRVFPDQDFKEDLNYSQRLKMFNPDLSSYHSNPFSGLLKFLKPKIRLLLKKLFLTMIENFRKIKIYSNRASCSLNRKKSKLLPFFDMEKTGFIDFRDFSQFGIRMG